MSGFRGLKSAAANAAGNLGTARYRAVRPMTTINDRNNMILH